MDEFNISHDEDYVKNGANSKSFKEYIKGFESWTATVEKKDSVTGREMCELVVIWLKATADIDITPERIWNISPTGELYYVFGLYNLALKWKMDALEMVVSG